MKFFKPFLLVFLVSLFVACDEIDELTQVDADFSLSKSIDVAVDEVDGGGDVMFSESETFDLTENSDVADNISRIQSVTINSLTYSFTNVIGETAVITNPQLTVGTTVINLDAVTPNDVVGQTFTVDDTAALNTIAAALLNNPQATVVYSGTVENAPLSLTLNTVLNVTVVLGL